MLHRRQCVDHSKGGSGRAEGDGDIMVIKVDNAVIAGAKGIAATQVETSNKVVARDGKRFLLILEFALQDRRESLRVGSLHWDGSSVEAIGIDKRVAVAENGAQAPEAVVVIVDGSGLRSESAHEESRE